VLINAHELLVMLAVMKLDSNAYGVPISALISESTGQEVALGRIYAALERLKARGLVGSVVGEPTAVRGGRAKTYFHLTSKGLRQVRETQQALQCMWTGLPQLTGRFA
jgi:PadR family transcriptional regulator PadR